MAKIKLIACDMDGTLLNSSKEIPQKNIEAVKRAKEAGILFVIATGRHDSMIKSYMDELEIEMPVISCNGAIVREPFTGRTFSTHPLSTEQMFAVIEACKETGADYHVYCRDTIYGEQVSGKIPYYIEKNRQLPDREKVRIHTDPDYRKFISGCDEGFYKVLVLSDSPEGLKAAEEEIKSKTGLEAAQSDSQLMDVMQKEISKAAALKDLCAELGIEIEETAAFGDQLNDLEMIRTAGLGVAMANAVDTVKEAADIVTSKNNCDAGVAEAIDIILSGN